MNEAAMADTEDGWEVAGPGWFVVNLRESAYTRCEGFGQYAPTEAVEVAEFGVGVHVLQPGEPNGLYHAEGNQEAFLVLHGECLLLVEGEERRLRQWDFVHSPPWTEHIFVGAGDAPCVILMVGGRSGDSQVRYPVSELAARHNASAVQDTSDPDEAYGTFEPSRRGRPSYWSQLPWA
jgi:uncharacterized cupin superfamily protein